ncbi:uncharacterized protein RSE6_10588 [Rhynchosporium secalis]|uniref:WW domain-containing protein n=1 Tax=Rhynchosporium secalis TaxID=38038 RepID=A0A1E1MKV8_RHYSE|nr:uncharacterized protein RSE6_10588 [Rhynchosporium secalis]
MHGNVTPDDPPPGNPSSMPGWNSQWSLEHQQFYYINTSTGERRWFVTFRPQNFSILGSGSFKILIILIPIPKYQPIPTPSPSSQPKPEKAAPAQKIQRKAVGAQSIRSNDVSPVAVTQILQANSGTVRAPLPLATDICFPTSSVQGNYQAPQVTKPVTPAPTITRNQSPPVTQTPKSPYRQLDLSGRFATLSIEHSQAAPANVPGSWPNQAPASQTVQCTQPQPSVAKAPVSPMNDQPNAHNFSSLPSTTHFRPPPPLTQYQSAPTPQLPDLPALGNAFAPSYNQQKVGSSPLIAPQPVVQRVPPPPPPRNLVPHQMQQAVGQYYAPPVIYSIQSANENHTIQYPIASRSHVIYQQQQQQTAFAPDSSQQHPSVPSAVALTQTQQSYSAPQTQSLQRYEPPKPGSVQPMPYSGQQLSTSPQQYATSSQNPATGQYAYLPPPPPAIQYNQQNVTGAMPHQGQSMDQKSSLPGQHASQFQEIPTQSTPVFMQASSLHPPPEKPSQQQQNYASEVRNHQIAPHGSTSSKTTTTQQCSTTSPTALPLKHYPTAPVIAQGPYQPPPPQTHASNAPPLYRYSSAPEAITYHERMITTQSTYSSPPEFVRNPYAQQVAHRIPVPQGQTGFQQQQPNFQPSESTSAYSHQGPPHLQAQILSRPQKHYQIPNQVPYQTQAPFQTQSPPLPPPRKSSSISTSGMMNKMGRQFSDFSKSATEKTKRFSVSQPGLMKWGTRAAVGIVAVGALALGVDAMGDAAGMFEGAGGEGGFSGGDFGGGEEAFGGGGWGDVGGGGDYGSGGGEEFGGAGDGGDGESVADAQTEVDANAAQLAMEQAGRENALMLLDPVGTEYETLYEARTTAGVNALI